MDKNNFSGEIKWSPGDIKCLIDLYKENIIRFDHLPKKKVWQEIALEMQKIRHKPITGDQCNGKWKGLKSMYKKVKDHNDTSGNSRKNWEYFEAMDEILYKRPEINLPATCSSDTSVLDIQSSSQTTEYDFHDFIEEASTPQVEVRSTLSRKRKENFDEAARNKRHNDRMAQNERFLNLFEKLVDKVVKDP